MKVASLKMNMSKVAIIITVLLPSIVIISPSNWAPMIAIIALFLFLPACRFIMPIPAIFLIILYSYFVWVYNDITIFTHLIGVYALFYFLIHERKLTSKLFLIIFFISGFLAFLQAFSSGLLAEDITLRELIGGTERTIFSFHSDMSHAFLEKIRPIGIFPSQVYYSQFVFSLVAIFALSGEDRKIVMILFGFIVAILGSTSGLIGVFLLILLGRSQNGYLAFVTCGLTIIAIYFFDPERYSYNYAIHNLVFSLFESRLIPLLSAQLSSQFTGILIYLGEFSLIIFILLISLLIVWTCNALVGQRTMRLGVGMLALVIGQFVGQAMGSFYFLISAGLFSALLYEVFSPSNKELDNSKV